MTRLASKLCTRVVCPTDILHQQMLEIGVTPHKITQFPYAIPPPARYPDRLESRRKFGIPEDAFVVSSLARVEMEKGFGELLHAAAKLPDPDCKLRVLIAGSGPALAELKEMGQKLLGSRAIFTGRVDDPAEVYAASDIFALPSYLEGFGLVYIEAAFHGVPSIGTDVGGIPEAILNGKTGILVPVKDIDATSDAIESFRSNPELLKQMGTAAKLRAATDFREDVFAQNSAKALLG